MRTVQFIVFFTVFLAVYFLVNYYIFIHGYWSIGNEYWLKIVYIGLFSLVSLSYLISRSIEHSVFVKTHHLFYWIGSMWFAGMLYFFLAVVTVDFIRLLNIIFHFLPSQNSLTYLSLKKISLLGSLALVFTIIAFGYLNATRPVIKQLKLSIPKKAGNISALTIAMVSDVHLGSLLNAKRVAQMVGSINNQKPDMVLIVGDVLDEVQKPIFRQNIGLPLKNLKSKFGVYGVTGNHEYIGGVRNAVKYLESLNIQMLRDTVVKIDDSFYLAGREDKDVLRFKGQERKPLKTILAGIDYHYPIILMDHQPFKLNEAVENGVDLQLSGHTHNGQFWPFNYITQMVYELSWGYKLKDHTHFYVSCGYGTWGPPVRIGNRPEIVIIQLTFQSLP